MKHYLPSPGMVSALWMCCAELQLERRCSLRGAGADSSQQTYQSDGRLSLSLITTYIGNITIMECQISRNILSYNYTTCLSCSLNIVIIQPSQKSESTFPFLYKFWYVLKNQSVMLRSSVVCSFCYVIITPYTFMELISIV